MQCAEFAQFLELEPDGPLPAMAADHLDRCTHCRLLFSDLEGIRLAGFEWAAAEQPAPSPRVWLALRAQLESEGLIRQPLVYEVPIHEAPIHKAKIRKPEPVRPSPCAHWARSWTQSGVLRPQLLGLSLPVLLVAFALLHIQGGLPGNVVRDSMIPAAADLSIRAPLAEQIDRTLDSDMRRVMASLPARRPSLTSALQQNLTIVDNMIATCEKSVREQPDNPMVREYLYGAYQQKAVLLSTAVERTTLEVR